MRTWLIVFTLCAAASAQGGAPAPVPTDRHWQRLPEPDTSGPRATLAAAAERLTDTTVVFAGVDVDSDTLAGLADTPCEEPLLRSARETLGRPVDLGDFLLFLDDLAHARAGGYDAPRVWVHSGRARSAGLLLSPGEVYGDAPNRYGGGKLALTRPPEPADLEPAADGDPLGPRWSARYVNPQTEAAKLRALRERGAGDFATRIQALLGQVRRQGSEAYLVSTVRHPERGYLMYGAFILSRASDLDEVARRVAKLERLNRAWDLGIPIEWRHPDSWRATVEQAQAMADAYNVAYASQSGARSSRHYEGEAVDFVVVDLPRRLTLTAPDGEAERRFDLSAPEESRDLNLTPRLLEWVEAHFGMAKLRSDYPHWTDARAAD
jgi:hypothetical protein